MLAFGAYLYMKIMNSSSVTGNVLGLAVTKDVRMS